MCLRTLKLMVALWPAMTVHVALADGKVVLPDGSGASFHIRRWTSEDGLPQNTINCLLQTHDGYLWIGTSDGLARYDGVKFTVYLRQLRMGSRIRGRVLDLAEDGNHCLWVRTIDGLAAFQHGRWRRYPCAKAPLNGPIQVFCANATGGVWVAMRDGLKLFQHGRITRVFTNQDGLFANHVDLIRAGTEGRLWLGFGSSGRRLDWQRLNPRTGKIIELQTLAGLHGWLPNQVYSNGTEGLWLSRSGKLVHWTKDGCQPYLLPGPHRFRTVTACAEDKTGALWLIRDGIPPVLRLHRRQWMAFGPNIGIRSTDLRCVLADRDGNVWVGTGDRGLLCFQRRVFSTILTTNALGWRSEVYSIAPGQEGEIWFATSQGLALLKDGHCQWFTNSEPDPDGFVQRTLRSVFEDSHGNVWFGLVGDGLYNWCKGRYVRNRAADLGFPGRRTVLTLMEDREGNLWIGSTRGLIRRSPAGRFESFSGKLGFPKSPVQGILQAPDDSLWVGTQGGGLYHLLSGKARRFTTRDGLLSQYAQPLYIETNGAVWVGTPFGLNRIRSGHIVSVTVAKGLFDNQAYCLLPDGRGNFWASCNRGIWRVRQSELDAVADGVANWVDCASFGQADGLASPEGNGECQPAAAQTADGRLWFSTTRGCAVIDPATEDVKHEAPPVVIQEVRVDGKTVYRDGGYAPDAESEVNGSELHLSPGQAQVLQIRYTANSFTAPRKVRFKYRLEGTDTGWHNVEWDERIATYTNLRPGDYTFRVEACNNHGVWNEAGATFAFTLAPKFTQTIWFPLALIAAGVVLAAGFATWRMNWQRRVLKLQQEQSLAEERTRIARDLHDDLGTALTGLALELDVIAAGADAAPNLAQRLDKTSNRTRDLAERMREVVWTVNPKCDTVSSVADFLEQQVGQFLRHPGLHVRFEVPESIPPLPLPGEARHQLALSVREALTNVVRHAEATEVIVSLCFVDQALVIEVRDNGRGFQPAKWNGHGLENLRTRLEQVGGKFDYTSSPGKGTTVTFRLPLQSDFPKEANGQ